MSFTTDFRKLIEQTAVELAQVPLEKTTIRPNPNKWSAIEIVGHLIDSATNNHPRFVKAQMQSHLIFDGYDQDLWVKFQHYQDANWLHLVELWKLYNLHICNIMEQTSEEKRKRPVKEHNLHQLALKPVPATESTTLEYFMQDYISHLKHHLKQIKMVISD